MSNTWFSWTAADNVPSTAATTMSVAGSTTTST
jgi:hypothetical protein